MTADIFPPVLMAALFTALLLGLPVAFALAWIGLVFGTAGIALGLFQPQLWGGIPERIFSVVSNELLLSVPFFTLMGLVLERSGIAEDLLDAIGRLFGSVRGSLAYAIILVGALLAATTGIMSATIITMGLVSLPVMLRYQYNTRLAVGVIAASGSLTQIIPPSIVLIILADQLKASVGDMYLGAMIPGLLLAALYAVYVFIVSIVRPDWMPGTVEESKRDDQSLAKIAVFLAVLCAAGYAGVASLPANRDLPFAETAFEAFVVVIVIAIAATLAHRKLGFGFFSRAGENLLLAILPPLGLILVVLGSILLGIATPTESAALGAAAALALAAARRRASLKTLTEAVDASMKLTASVVFILVGSQVFTLTFYSVDGQLWVEKLFHDLPGGQLGFLIVINAILFVLAFFLDFFELAFIVIPLIAPLLPNMGIDPIWFGIIVAINFQTAFLHPPFGFALLFLKSVAPPSVRPVDLYMGALPFLAIQVLLLALLIAFPSLVTMNLNRVDLGDTSNVRIMQEPESGREQAEDALFEMLRKK